MPTHCVRIRAVRGCRVSGACSKGERHSMRAPRVYRSRPTKVRRTKAEMNEIQKAIYTMLKQVHPMTVRQVFYQLVRPGCQEPNVVANPRNRCESFSRLVSGQKLFSASGQCSRKGLLFLVLWRIPGCRCPANLANDLTRNDASHYATKTYNVSEPDICLKS